MLRPYSFIHNIDAAFWICLSIILHSQIDSKWTILKQKSKQIDTHELDFAFRHTETYPLRITWEIKRVRISKHTKSFMVFGTQLIAQWNAFYTRFYILLRDFNRKKSYKLLSFIFRWAFYAFFKHFFFKYLRFKSIFCQINFLIFFKQFSSFHSSYWIWYRIPLWETSLKYSFWTPWTLASDNTRFHSIDSSCNCQTL